MARVGSFKTGALSSLRNLRFYARAFSASLVEKLPSGNSTEWCALSSL
jgi:hypothetical protein